MTQTEQPDTAKPQDAANPSLTALSSNAKSTAPPNDSQTGPPAAELMGPVGIILLGLFHVLLAVTLVHLTIVLWPDGIGGTASAPVKHLMLFRVIPLEVAPEIQLVLFAMVTGAAGSFIHGATSFSTYVGNGTLTRRWAWWYLLRPLIGGGLAVLFYWVLRSGFFNPNNGTTGTGSTGVPVNAYGTAALAGLVGMFSKQASDKLQEIFVSAFRTAPGQGDDQRKDKVTGNPKPTLTGVSPTKVNVGDSDIELIATGAGFVEGSCIRFDGKEQATKFGSGTQLTAILTANYTKSACTIIVTVFNPLPGGGTSEPQQVEVVPLGSGTAEPQDIAGVPPTGAS